MNLFKLLFATTVVGMAGAESLRGARMLEDLPSVPDIPDPDTVIDPTAADTNPADAPTGDGEFCLP